MDLLEAYAEYMNAGDAEKISSLFAEDASFTDYVPTKLGVDPIIIKGKQAISAMFKETFAHVKVKAVNVLVNENAMRYDIIVNDASLLALGVMKEENGLIKDYKILVL